MNQPTTSPAIQSTTSPAAIAVGLYSAVLGGDVAGIADHVADDLVLHVPGTHALAGEHRGAANVLTFLERSRALTDTGEHIEVIDVLEGRDHAAVYCRVTATREGRPPLDNLTVHLLRIHGGKVAEISLHNRDDRPVDEFWS
jgi:ketosteroid isomerase-like protein